MNCFFTSSDDEWFQPTDHTRGPWHRDHCHAGPPTGLLARSVEQLVPQQRLTRLTVNLLRPIPFAGFRITAALQKQGRLVSTCNAAIVDEHDKVCAQSYSLHMTEQPAVEMPSHHIETLDPNDAGPGLFPIQQTLHDLPAFNGDGVAVRYPPGHDHRPGPTVAWMKTVPLLSTETPSPFQRLCPLADCGNAFGRNADPSEVQFMNPDLTIHCHRDPLGDWLGTDVAGFWEPNGIGMADAHLFDRAGSVGRAVQTLLLQAVAENGPT
jgi:hypothetical protein